MNVGHLLDIHAVIPTSTWRYLREEGLRMSLRAGYTVSRDHPAPDVGSRTRSIGRTVEGWQLSTAWIGLRVCTVHMARQ